MLRSWRGHSCLQSALWLQLVYAYVRGVISVFVPYFFSKIVTAEFKINTLLKMKDRLHQLEIFLCEWDPLNGTHRCLGRQAGCRAHCPVGQLQPMAWLIGHTKASQTSIICCECVSAVSIVRVANTQFFGSIFLPVCV